jgi:hypothetical protein
VRMRGEGKIAESITQLFRLSRSRFIKKKEFEFNMSSFDHRANDIQLRLFWVFAGSAYYSAMPSPSSLQVDGIEKHPQSVDLSAHCELASDCVRASTSFL